MSVPVASLRAEEKGQDIAEYAVMLAVILVIVVNSEIGRLKYEYCFLASEQIAYE